MYERMLTAYVVLSDALTKLEAELRKNRLQKWFYVVDYHVSLLDMDVRSTAWDVKMSLIQLDHAIQWLHWEEASSLVGHIERRLEGL